MRGLWSIRDVLKGRSVPKGTLCPVLCLGSNLRERWVGKAGTRDGPLTEARELRKAES